jgi:thiamine biosynthesis lipoprotein
VIVEHRFRVMNTDALLMMHPRPHRSAIAAAGLAEAEALARETERTFSRFIATSELCRLNDSAGSWVDVSSEMSEVLELAIGLHEATGGLFDPSILPDLERAGYDRTFEDVAAEHDIDEAPRVRAAVFRDIELGHHRVRLPAGMRIDLGGIVKGWAADLLADRLADLGPCLVELGGDVAVRGRPSGTDGWEIGLQVPGSEGELLGVVRVAEGGVATSGTDARRWRRGGAWTHHIIDPRSGEPTRSELAQVTAFAGSAACAEVWAKAALIAGVDGAAEILAAQPAVELVLVPTGRAAVASRGVSFVYGPPVPT